MLRVIIELVPFGREHEKKKIGEMLIANVGQDSNGSKYNAVVGADSWSKEPMRVSSTDGWDRTRNVWDLIEEILIQRRKVGTSETIERLTKRLEERFR